MTAFSTHMDNVKYQITIASNINIVAASCFKSVYFNFTPIQQINQYFFKKYLIFFGKRVRIKEVLFYFYERNFEI